MEIAIPDYREYEFARNGFIPLVYRKGSGEATFFSTQSIKRAKKFKDPKDSENSQLVTNLAYTFSITRLAHYVKSIMRDNIGSTADAGYVQRQIDVLADGYVTTVVNPDDLTLRRFPFKATSVRWSRGRRDRLVRLQGGRAAAHPVRRPQRGADAGVPPGLGRVPGVNPFTITKEGHNASILPSLDVYQGFNFKKDKQSPVGYITAAEVGDRGPDGGSGDHQGPGAAGQAPWLQGGGGAQPLPVGDGRHGRHVPLRPDLHGEQADAGAALLGSWSNIEVTFNYVIYEYDPLAKKYFKSNYVDAALKGMLEKSGDDLNLSVADDPSTEVQSPKNFTFQIGIKPQTTEQTVNLATASRRTSSSSGASPRRPRRLGRLSGASPTRLRTDVTSPP